MDAELPSLRPLVLETGDLLASLDFAQWRVERAPELRRRTQQLVQRAKSLLDHPAAPATSRTALEQLAGSLERSLPVSDEPTHWELFSRSVLPEYHALAHTLGADDVPVRALRPTNIGRSVFHALTGIFALGVIQATSSRLLSLIAVSAAVGCWTLEISRRRSARINAACMWVLGRFAHAHERYQVNSSTWYATALAIMAVALPARSNSVGVIVLGFGDPVAAFIGRRFGKTRFASGRSLEGSLAFVVAAAVTALIALRVCHPAESMTLSMIAALAGATAGALAELLSPTDDNFSIPLAASIAATAAVLL